MMDGQLTPTLVPLPSPNRWLIPPPPAPRAAAKHEAGRLAPLRSAPLCCSSPLASTRRKLPERPKHVRPQPDFQAGSGKRSGADRWAGPRCTGSLKDKEHLCVFFFFLNGSPFRTGSRTALTANTSILSTAELYKVPSTPAISRLSQRSAEPAVSKAPGRIGCSEGTRRACSPNARKLQDELAGGRISRNVSRKRGARARGPHTVMPVIVRTEIESGVTPGSPFIYISI